MRHLPQRVSARQVDLGRAGCSPPGIVSEPVVIELVGEPRGKGRPRFARRTGHVFTPQRTASYEAMLRHEAALVMATRPPLKGTLRVQVSAYFGVPQSWSAKKRTAALAGTIRPAKRPDLDNVAKMLDAFNGVVWIDDAQIVSGLIEKHYSDRPRLRVEVSGLGAQS
jgi:Holliday junction resolvase RusA-like endonuclease